MDGEEEAGDQREGGLKVIFTVLGFFAEGQFTLT